MRRLLAALLTVMITAGCAATQSPREAAEVRREWRAEISKLEQVGESLEREIKDLEEKIAWRDEAIESLSKDVGDTRVLRERLGRLESDLDAYEKRIGRIGSRSEDTVLDVRDDGDRTLVAPPHDVSVPELQAEVARLEQRNKKHEIRTEELRRTLKQRRVRLLEVMWGSDGSLDLVWTLWETELLRDAYRRRYGELPGFRELQPPEPRSSDDVRAMGHVLSVAPDADLGTLVAISLGSDNGVRVGQEFDIYRRLDRVGRIEIVDVSARSAFGRVVVEPGTLTDAQRGNRAHLHLPDGRVLSTKATDVGTFVAISVGRRDGVRVGDRYHISRGDSYIGRVTVIRVSEESAYCRAENEWVTHWPPLPGDRAWTE